MQWPLLLTSALQGCASNLPGSLLLPPSVVQDLNCGLSLIQICLNKIPIAMASSINTGCIMENKIQKEFSYECFL